MAKQIGARLIPQKIIARLGNIRVGHIAHQLDLAIRPPIENRSQLSLRSLFALLFITGGIYGAIMGSFSWAVGFNQLHEQWPQMLCSAIKVPLLLIATTLIAIPSFFVFNTLAGLRDDFSIVVAALIRSQAAMAVTLAACAPLTLFFYMSLARDNRHYLFAVLVNGIIFAVASLAVQIHVSQSYEKLIIRNPRHRILKRLWFFIYAFVGIQLGWNLRPFVGSPAVGFSVFRESGWDNAYIEVGILVSRFFQRLFGVT